MNDREATFKQLVQQFPDSPMGHFSLGRLYVDEKRWVDAIEALNGAVKADPNYAAAFVALGDAHAGCGQKEEAKTAWARAIETPHGQRDASLQADLEQRIREIDDF